jgi:rod shape determining protein RodA
MVIMAGVRWFYIGMLGLGAGIAAPLIYFILLRDYMRERFTSFLDPAGDPLGTGYNILQSEIGVGSGGFWGKGFTQGTQSQLHFLRVQSTDFIFSVVGEELGFVGAVILLALFGLLLFRGLRVIALSRDVFGRLLATGIVTMILIEVFINIGVNVRLLPVTGIPLPFISYGGSSLLTLFIALGILQSILLRHKRVEF